MIVIVSLIVAFVIVATTAMAIASAREKASTEAAG